MTSIHKLLLCLCICYFCFSCDSGNHKQSESANEYAAENAASSQVPAVIGADTLASEPFASPERKFIRTADIKFKTNDVKHATETIENLTRKRNGFVTQAHLASSIISTSTIPVSADSLLEREEYVVENTMTIRVPNTQLDSLLNEIGKLADFVDFRILKADDVQLQLLENTLKNKRALDAEKRYTKAIEAKSKKLNENIQAEEQVLALQNEADSRTLNTMAYLDKINFSTISLKLYQAPAFKYAKFFNHQNIKTYEPSLLSRLSEAFAKGWTIFEELLVFLVRIWALLLLAMGGWWFYKRYKWRVLGKL